MNILTDEEMKQIHADTFGKGVQSFARAIEAAVLKKLAEQVDMEPAAHIVSIDDEPELGHWFSEGPADAEGMSAHKLYTETQLLAAQQKAAEACAKAVFEQAKYFGYNAHAEAVRYAALNKWSEYL